MSSVARKSGNRTVTHRQRDDLVISRRIPANSVALLFEEDVKSDPNVVCMPVTDVKAFMDRMDDCVERTKLTVLSHQFFDSGVFVHFRSKQEAEIFRQVMAE